MEAFEKLYDWIESWHQADGYGGFLHHAIHGTVNWEHAKLVPSYTYEPLINGFINLYKKNNDIKWLKKAEIAAKELIDILDDVNQFKYSGFEFAPKSGSVVHTINPLFSFYDLYRITKNKKYIETSKKVLESVICLYWRGDHFSGPFNMTLMISAAIAEYCSIINDWRLNDLYGKYTFEIIKNHKVGKEGGLAEGLYYRNVDDHSIIFPWYNAVKATAMIRYGSACDQDVWIEEGKNILIKIKELMIDGYLLPHSFQKNENGIFECIMSPVLIAPSAYVLTQLQKNHLLSYKELQESIKNLLNTQTEIGFFPANQGYDWRSKVGVTAWNCFVFELFSINEYIKCNSKPVGKYACKENDISIYENDSSFKIKYKDIDIFSIEKKNGLIRRKNLLLCDFKINKNDIKKGLHINKMCKQQNKTVSYIDDLGNGVWLEQYDGMIMAWSPYYTTTLNSKCYIKSKHKYEKFSFALYHILLPIIYKKQLVSLITRGL